MISTKGEELVMRLELELEEELMKLMKLRGKLAMGSPGVWR